MPNVYDWLDNTDQTHGAPPEPMDENHFAGIPAEEITPLDLDEDGNMYFEYSQADDESLPIDPSLYMATDHTAPTTSRQTIVMVPEHLAGISSKILIYLAQVLEVPETDEESVRRMTFTTEELEDLESVTEEDSEPSIPDDIDGVRVNRNPETTKIEDVIDIRRVGLDRKTFYLARSIDGIYYWFHPSLAGRDQPLRRLIRDYRRKSRMEATRRRTPGVRKLRSGRKIRM
jgi:hypothetical protein